MDKKKIIIGATILPVASFASFVSMIDDDIAKYSIGGEEVLKNITAWLDKGSEYDCSNWLPEPSNVNYGEDFKQEKVCDQDQERTVDVYKEYTNSEDRYLRTDIQGQTIQNRDEQDSVGTRNFELNTDYGVWSIWADKGVVYDCLTWTPDPFTVNHGEAFTQNRDCKQAQERNRDVLINWADGTTTVDSIETEDQFLTILESQPSVGTKNYILGTSYGEWSVWENQNIHYDCLVWTPDVSTINYGDSFIQTRDCSQDQEQERDVFDDYADGTKVWLSTELASQTIIEEETQPEVGTKNFVNGTSYGEWSVWTNKNTHYDCNTWTPDASTINYGDSFIQARDCSQDQEQERDVFDDYADGTSVWVSLEKGLQTITEQESQAETGTKNFVNGTSYGSWSGWSDVGSHYDCDTWSPLTNTVNHGASFTQNRDCKQNQERTRTIYDDYADGTKVDVGLDTDSQTLNESESQSAVGVKDYIVGTRTGVWSSWVDSGIHYDCEDYSPLTTTINHGTSFTQSRGCKQEQTRNRTIYNDWKVAADTVKNTESDSQTLTETETRPATGTKNFVNGTSYGSWSSWSDIGSHYDCDDWSPLTNTVNHGTSFTQNRDCKQNQERTRTIYDDYADGTKVDVGLDTDSQTLNESESQSAVGVKDYIVGTVTGSWTSWSNSGSSVCDGTWSPLENTVNDGTSFTQTSDCDQDQTRSRTIYDDWKVKANTYKSTEYDAKTIDVIESRPATGTKDYIIGTVTGSWTSWSNSGGHYGCGTWSPDPSTVDDGTSFTQSRDCDQNQTRSRTIYNDWKLGANTVKNTENGSQTISVEESRGSTGTKPTTECRYYEPNGVMHYGFVYSEPGSHMRIYWNQVKIADYYGPPNKQVGAYYYWVGDVINEAGGTFWREVCRRPN